MSPKYKEEISGNYWLNQIKEQEQYEQLTTAYFKSLEYANACNFLWSISLIDEAGNYVCI